MAAVVESFAVKQISDVVAAAFSGGPQVSPRLVMFVNQKSSRKIFWHCVLFCSTSMSKPQRYKENQQIPNGNCRFLAFALIKFH